jgi:hypothetical protein
MYQRPVSRIKTNPPAHNPMAKDPDIFAITTSTSPTSPSPSGTVAPVTRALPKWYTSGVFSAQRRPEWQQRQIVDDGHGTVELAAVSASLDNPMIAAGSDQQSNGGYQKPQPNSVDAANTARKRIEAVVEHTAKPESEQNLRPEDQNPGLHERALDLLRQLHAPKNTRNSRQGSGWSRNSPYAGWQ